MRTHIPNEVFFATPEGPVGPPAIPEATFYAGRLRPPPEIPVATRAAATSMRYALAAFLIGWAGILFQASFLQQVVFGAPVFEELAKLGPALLVATLVGARSLWVRMPLAWASGAGFGVMEHYLTYSDEPFELYVGRIVFHAAAPGLSMLVFTVVEDLPDVRARWAATIPSTLVHWGNNFGAVVIGFASIFLPIADPVALGWATLMTSAVVVLSLAGIFAHGWFVATVRGTLNAAMPRLGFAAPRLDVAEERALDNV